MLSSSGSPGLAGRIFSSFFFLAFGGMGLFVGGLLVSTVVQKARQGGPIPWPVLLFLLLPLLFLAVGVAGLYRTWKPAPPADAVSLALQRSSRTSWLPAPQGGDPTIETLEPLVLKPRHTRVGTFFGVLFFAAFWNGIVGVFVWQLARSFRQGDPAWGPALFLSIFVLIGLALLLAVPYQLLALWNPRPHLTLGRGTLRLGDRVDLEWRFTGRAGRIRRLRITFEGREEATYVTTSSRRGSSSTSTAKEVFRTLEVADTTDPTTIASGTARIAIPANTMHSFRSSNNRIVWSLKVAGEIRHWPDVADEFELAVLPQTAGGHG